MPIFCDCACEVDWLLTARNFLLIATPMFFVASWIALKLLGPFLKGEVAETKKPWIVYQGGRKV